MRLCLVAVVAVLLLGCPATEPPKTDPFQVRAAVWAITIAQSMEGAVSPDPATPPTPAVKTCLGASDPAYPWCECRANPSACPHTPKCYVARQSLLPPAVTTDTCPIAPTAFEVWKKALPKACLIVATQPNCPPCTEGARTVIAPMVANGWYVVYLDVRRDPTIRDALGITETPTYIGYFAGDEVGRSTLPRTNPTSLWTTIPQWFKDKDTGVFEPAPKPPAPTKSSIVPAPPSE
jgi:hypothetical protein